MNDLPSIPEPDGNPRLRRIFSEAAVFLTIVGACGVAIVTMVFSGAAIVTMSGCEQRSYSGPPPVVCSTADTQGPSWKVEGQGTFHAGYNNTVREILLITSPSGKRFIAITDCGLQAVKDEEDRAADAAATTAIQIAIPE